MDIIKFKEYRKSFNYSRKQISEFLDLEIMDYLEIENYKKEPSIIQLESLCNLYLIDFEDFYKEPKKSIIPIVQLNKEEMKSVASFNKIVKNYIKMKKVLNNE